MTLEINSLEQLRQNSGLHDEVGADIARLFEWLRYRMASLPSPFDKTDPASEAYGNQYDEMIQQLLKAGADAGKSVGSVSPAMEELVKRTSTVEETLRDQVSFDRPDLVA